MSDNENEYKPERDRNGYFKKGFSGNPKGRNSGHNKSTLAVKALLEGEAEGLTRKAVQLGLAGDTVALKLCMDRIAPPRRSAPVPFDLPKMETIADMPNAVAAVSRAMANGLTRLSPSPPLWC